jgi:hypothetical protein
MLGTQNRGAARGRPLRDEEAADWLTFLNHLDEKKAGQPFTADELVIDLNNAGGRHQCLT